MNTNTEIAKTILEQLGGGKFAFMVGAKNLTAVERGLSFRIPGTMTRNRINYVRITLDDMDTYRIEFAVIRGHTFKVLTDLEGVYAEDMGGIFREYTGLETRMPTVRFA